MPTLVSLATVPLYLRWIGATRYGVLLLAFAFLGYFGAFDLGLGRAAAQSISREDNVVNRNLIFSTSLILSFGMGLLGAAVLYLLGEWFFATIFHIPENLHKEILGALPWLAAIVPITSIISVLAGSLQARHAFIWLNVSQTLGVIGLQVFPLVFAITGHIEMSTLLAAALLGRLLGVALMFAAIAKELPLCRWPAIHLPMVSPLLRFGGWVTVSGLVTPLLSIIDRFIIAAQMNAIAVTDYVIPYNLTQRFNFLPSALSTTLFPRFASAEKDEVSRWLHEGVSALFALQTPFIVLGILGMHPAMVLWIGPNIASNASPVAIIILLGIWINGPNYVPHNLLPAIGRPDIMARFYLAELLPFLGILWELVERMGILGAAIACALRSVADAVFCYWATHSLQTFLRSIAPTVPSVGLACWIQVYQPLNIFYSILIGFIAFTLSILSSWWISPSSLKTKIAFSRKLAQ